MPRPRKVFLNKSAVFITTRTVEGLPFTAASFMKLILKSVIARAQFLYPNRIFFFMFMGNHLHLGLVVEDPESVPNFMEYVKGESAGLVNRLLGRSKRKVWEDGYDSPIILDVKKAKEVIVYAYSNPAKADLVESIDDYPGLSSWKQFLDLEGPEQCPWVRRKRVEKLPKRNLSIKEQDLITENLIEDSQTSFTLTVEPNCWIECFPELSNIPIEEINADIYRQIKEYENNRKAKRKRSVVGAKRLTLGRVDRHFLPRTRGRRTWCISSDRELRELFIEKLQHLFDEARAVYKLWKLGLYWIPFPPGLFPPSQPRKANLFLL